MMDNSYSNTGRYPPDREAAPSGTKTEQAREESRRLAEKAKEQGQSLLAEQKKATADEIGGVAEALRKAAHEMHQQEHPPMITPYAERAAEGLERFSSTLRERDLNALVQQTEDFARRQPGIFVGGAVVTGFLLARFFRSSALHGEYDYAHPSHGSSGHTTPPSQGRKTAYTPPPSRTTESSTGVRPGIPPAGTTASTPHTGEP